MRSFVIFSVLGQNYAVDIESVKRILPAQELTENPEEGPHVEGMFQYEKNVLKVLSFRKAIGQKSYEEKLQAMFPEIKAKYKAWFEALRHSVETGEAFEKTTDPHACDLGKWIDSFYPDDEEVLSLMKKLNRAHQDLFTSAMSVLEKRAASVDEAKRLMAGEIRDTYNDTLVYLGKIAGLSHKVAAELQRCLIIEDKNGKFFGLNIDSVEDIVHVEEDELHEVQQDQHMGDFMNVAGILTHNKKLVTIIKDISLEQRGA